MNTNTVKIEWKAEFDRIVKRSMIRELYEKHKITQAQYEQLMQLQRSH